MEWFVQWKSVIEGLYYGVNSVSTFYHSQVLLADWSHRYCRAKKCYFLCILKSFKVPSIDYQTCHAVMSPTS